MKPRWVPRAAVLAIHDALLAEHGGPSGILSEANLEASLDSPRNLFAYEKADVFALAAKYAFALTKNHPFRDGNKRIALTVAGVFLELNGKRLEAPEPEAVAMTMGLAAGTIDEAGYATWLGRSSKPIRLPQRRGTRRRKR